MAYKNDKNETPMICLNYRELCCTERFIEFGLLVTEKISFIWNTKVGILIPV
jgi:hypothetical protein